MLEPLLLVKVRVTKRNGVRRRVVRNLEFVELG